MGFGYISSELFKPHALAAGIYGLSNATLDTPWPKLLQCRNALGQILAQSTNEVNHDALFALLAQCADSHTPLEQRLLSAPFIAGSDYGTRASTVLLRRADGAQYLEERRFGPHGCYLGSSHATLP